MDGGVDAMIDAAAEEPPPSPPGRRERKKLATRAAVREAALRLAVRHGVERVTVEQIAAEADIAVRTFFNHFSGKEEAIVAAATAGAEALVAEFRARPRAESVLTAVREAVLAVMDRTDAAGRDHLTVLRLMRTTPSLLPQQMAVLTTQERALARAIADRLAAASAADGGAAVDDVHAHLCAASALAALRIVLDRWLTPVGRGAGDPGDIPPLDVLRTEIDYALALLAGGLDRGGAAAD